MQVFEQIGIHSICTMLLNGDNGARLNHCLVCVIVSMGLIPVFKRVNVLAVHRGARGLVCALNSLKIFVYLGEGLLRIFLVPLGLVLPVKVVIMLNLASRLGV